MNSRTRAERLGEPLIRNLAQQTVIGNSLVILSPRFGGKSLTMRNLGDKLKLTVEDRLIRSELFSPSRINRERDAVAAIIRGAPLGMGLSASTFRELADGIQTFSLHNGTPVI